MSAPDRHLIKENVVRDTHYGTNVYTHILRSYYPGETLMYVSGEECGWLKNPWDNSRQSLHVWIEKREVDGPFPERIARHHDASGNIPDGTFLDFAAFFYKKEGMELLEILNQELHLHLGNEEQQGVLFQSPLQLQPYFSFFKAPIRNTIPYKQINLRDTWNYITGHYAKDRTLDLRGIRDPQRARAFKASRFDYVTFSGTFTARKEDRLVKHSGLLCLDFDHVPKLEEFFQALKSDQQLQTQLLFRSPSGDGLKWVIKIDLEQCRHAEWFRAVANYVFKTYHIPVDPSGKDICRACFLPWDPRAYLSEDIY
ncbi:MAG: hypothetical protein IJV32_02015 [Bacteroidales bacterium]|nr:hypothetical protein [Bacteroidales bacterium]